jgi:xylulokinase
VYLGIDLGTSAVKAVLVDDDGSVVAQSDASVQSEQPEPGWWEQDPAQWIQAVSTAVESIGHLDRDALHATRAIGLSGHKTGLVALGADQAPLMPAIIWRDQRSAAEARWLHERMPEIQRIAGAAPAPAFIAPKLRWLAIHRPEIYGSLAHVLLPKDYVRLHLTGELATDLSDASLTLCLDEEKRAWSPSLIAKFGFSPSWFPRALEGTERSGSLRSDIATKWGLKAGIPVAAGGGDNACAALAGGIHRPGTAQINLGTGSSLLSVLDQYSPPTDPSVGVACHCVPGRWHLTAIVLSAASCLTWLASVSGCSVPILFEEMAARRNASQHQPPWFLPYLVGERTPHNDSDARGVFFGLNPKTERADLAYSVVEGVSFAVADAWAVLESGSPPITEVQVVGGGASSSSWMQILASVLGHRLTVLPHSEVGSAYGAASLGRLCLTGDAPDSLDITLGTAVAFPPDETETEQSRLLERRKIFQDLYGDLHDRFRAASALSADQNAAAKDDSTAPKRR